jgi:hypothetical protein
MKTNICFYAQKWLGRESPARRAVKWRNPPWWRNHPPRQAPDTLPASQTTLDVTGVIRKAQRSNRRERAKTVALCAHFVSCFTYSFASLKYLWKVWDVEASVLKTNLSGRSFEARKRKISRGRKKRSRLYAWSNVSYWRQFKRSWNQSQSWKTANKTSIRSMPLLRTIHSSVVLVSRMPCFIDPLHVSVWADLC